MITNPTYQEECVQKGVALLDEKHPGWADKIDLETFDLTDGNLCVIGQIYGNFMRGSRQLFHLRDDLEAFEVGENYGFYDDQEGSWPALDAIWRGVIVERQS